ncbi:hypothetical protein Tco_0383746, partial [Tanacetum coccineum]
KTPYGSLPPPPPPPPPLAGASGALGTSRASGSSQLTPPPPSSTDTNRGNPQQSSGLQVHPILRLQHNIPWLRLPLTLDTSQLPLLLLKKHLLQII